MKSPGEKFIRYKMIFEILEIHEYEDKFFYYVRNIKYGAKGSMNRELVDRIPSLTDEEFMRYMLEC